jgi:hypothetical protein
MIVATGADGASLALSQAVFKGRRFSRALFGTKMRRVCGVVERIGPHLGVLGASAAADTHLARASRMRPSNARPSLPVKTCDERDIARFPERAAAGRSPALGMPLPARVLLLLALWALMREVSD